MAKRRKKKESGLDALLAAPWWFSAIVAVGAYALFQWILPAMLAGSPLTKAVGLAFKPLGTFIASICGLIAVVLFFVQRSRHTLIPLGQHREPAIAPNHIPSSTNPGSADHARDSLMARETSSPPPKPTEWSIALLRRIEWKRFEEVCAAFYQEIGLRSETIRCGADGGIDAKLFEGNAQEPAAIVQCKAWSSRAVGVKPVRELLGVMAHEGVPKGIFIATGDFTNEATEFAKTNPLELVTGPAFLDMISRLPEDAQKRLLAVATEGDYITPSCPSCGIKMTMRSSTRGDFWGCRNYPRCKHRFYMKTETT